MDEVVLRVVDARSDAARWAMTQYFDELSARFPGGFDPGGALSDAGEVFNPPRGVFVVGDRGDGSTVACGAVQLLGASGPDVEIKRMWVSPEVRGLGVGRRLLARLEDEARSRGRRRVLLDTNGSLVEAIAMYRSCGYVEVERYNDNPYAEHWFAKHLTS